jgi:hypothetical protein
MCCTCSIWQLPLDVVLKNEDVTVLKGERLTDHQRHSDATSGQKR